jgi:hypothetical protein
MQDYCSVFLPLTPGEWLDDILVLCDGSPGEHDWGEFQHSAIPVVVRIIKKKRGEDSKQDARVSFQINTTSMIVLSVYKNLNEYSFADEI